MASPEIDEIDFRLDYLETELRSITRVVWWIALVLGLLLCMEIKQALGQEVGKAVATTTDAVGWALGDLATLNEADRPFQRYLWIPPWGDDKWVPAMDFTINTAVSHASVIQLGTPIANGWALRYDLRRLAPTAKQLEKLLATWDGLAVQDPYFHVPENATGLAKIILAPHLRQPEAVALAGLSLSTGAIYRSDWFLVKALSTLEGGKYYDFLQIPEKVEEEKPKEGEVAKPKQTPQDIWLATLGAFESTTQNLNGDQRSAIFRSGVTGKPRRIDVFYGLGRGGNLVTITHDIADEDVKAGQHPIRNLLKFDDRAREIIVQRPNGTHAFALTNDKGEFQDTAPDNIAQDHMIPAPHTARLQPAIGCIRCHGPFSGYQPFGNDVQKIISSRLDVFTDLSSGELSREQVIDKLAGLYSGYLDTPDAPIGRARRDYSAAMFKIMGPINPFVEDPDANPAVLLSAKVSEIYGSYRYDLITPEKVCMENGLQVNDGQGITGLEQLLKGPPAGTLVSPITGTLLAGISINRADYEADAPDIASAISAATYGQQAAEQERIKREEQAAKDKAAKAKAEQDAKDKTDLEAKEKQQKEELARAAKTEKVETPAISKPSQSAIDHMLVLHNVERSKLGLKPFAALSPDLSRAAQQYAEVCFKHQAIDHRFDGLGNVRDRLDRAGVVYLNASENLAWAGMKGEVDVMRDWKVSPSHWNNIAGNWTEIGIGSSGPAWCVIFANRKK